MDSRYSAIVRRTVEGQARLAVREIIEKGRSGAYGPVLTAEVLRAGFARTTNEFIKVMDVENPDLYFNEEFHKAYMGMVNEELDRLFQGDEPINI